MPRIPAVCKKCGKIFQSSFNVGGTVVMQDCVAGPCPFCGGSGSIPSGIYTTLTNAALIFAAGKILPPQFRNFISIIESAIKNKEDAIKVSMEIKENMPELSSVADALPKTRNELYAFLAILIALVTLILNTCKSDKEPPPVSKIQINNFVNQAIENMYGTEIPVPHSLKPKTTTKQSVDKKKMKSKNRKRIAKISKRKNR
jgi:hypothetical protein